MEWRGLTSHPDTATVPEHSPRPCWHVGSKRLTASPFPGTHLLTVCHGPPPRAAFSPGLRGRGGNQLRDAIRVQKPCRIRLKPTPLRLPPCSAPSPAPSSLPHSCSPQIPRPQGTTLHPNPISGSASGEPDLRHREKLHS